MSQGNAIAVFDPSTSRALVGVAEHLFGSGMYPNIKNPAGAFAVAQYGFELGIGPMMALQNINVIQGKPTCSGQLMLALFQQRGGNITVEEESEQRVTIVFTKGSNNYRCTFTKDDATRAGLSGKDNWKKWPTQMLYWRCVAKGVRAIDPGAVMGLYTADEISNGDTVDAAPLNANQTVLVDMGWLAAELAAMHSNDELAAHWKRNAAHYNESANFKDARDAYAARRAEIDARTVDADVVPDTITPDQLKAIQAHYTARGMERSARLADLSSFFGRPITSANDLTCAEASDFIHATRAQ